MLRVVRGSIYEGVSLSLISGRTITGSVLPSYYRYGVYHRNTDNLNRCEDPLLDLLYHGLFNCNLDTSALSCLQSNYSVLTYL